MRIRILTYLLLFSCVVTAQEVMTFDEYIDQVYKHHPVSYQAGLLSDMADSQERMARGGFDPKLEADWDHKSYDDKNYFSVLSSTVKVPTWYGIEVKAGYDRNNGDFLSTSHILPSRGLWNAGISVPLGRGFILDDRRAELEKAMVYREATQQEQILMVNELLFEAANAYLNWQIAIAYLEVAEEGLELAQTRLTGTIGSFVNGDKPAIDTLESFISVQSREFDVQKARQDLVTARYAIENFLWIDGEVPLELLPEAIPEAYDTEKLAISVDSLSLTQDLWIAAHPELLLYDYKIDNIQIDERLFKEDLKPDLRVNYNPLVGVADDALFDQFSAQNYKVGATFSYPLMQRKQRGKLQLTRLKREQTEFDQLLKAQDLSVKLSTYVNNIRQTREQYALLGETVVNYNRMLIAENRKFEIGESSIFLINSREVKYLDSRYKLISAAQKLIYNRYTYLLYAARMSDVL